jgi:phospholipase/carboxylesterase
VPTRISRQITFKNGWVAKVQQSPDKFPSKIIVLLHGWTGDEESMNIFVRNFNEDYLLISPRGSVISPQGGHGWVALEEKKFPGAQEFLPAAATLVEELKTWIVLNGYKPSNLNLIGFSQGACMAYILSIMYKDLFEKTACLSGYLPGGLENRLFPQSLAGQRFFITHGTLDETVPVEFARNSAKTLIAAGADVNYCEENVGHKLSLPCFKALENFIQN